MVEARRSPLPREAQEQTTCDRWEEPGVGAAGSLPSLATRLLGADFRKGKCCAGAALPVVAAARASGQAQQIRGCCPTPGGARGTFPGQEPRAQGTTARHNLPLSSVGLGWGALGIEGLTRCPGTVASLFGSLQSANPTRAWLLAPCLSLPPGPVCPAHAHTVPLASPSGTE